MEVRLPKKHELRLYHLEALKGIKEEGLTAYEKIDVVHKLTGLPKDKLRDASLKDLTNLLNHFFNLIASIEKETPSKEIEVLGKKYTLVRKFSEMPMSWHIDRSVFDLKDLSIMLAFCYIEKGMKYAQQDEHKNILNPVMKRAELFREFVEMEHFVKVGFFFQKKAQNYTNAYMEIEKQRKKKVDIRNTNGNELLV